MLFGDQSDGGPLLGRTLTVLGQSELLLKYLGLGVLPVPDLLSIDHSVIALHSRIWSHSNGMPGLIAILAIPICSVMFILLWVMWAMRNRRRFPLVTLCCFWIVVGHLPTMVFPRNEQFVEYRSYVPMIGFTLLVSLGMMRAHELLSQRFKHARTTLGSTLLPMVIVGGLLTSTISRNAVWASKADLWMDAARKAPHSWRTNNNAGVELMEEGRFHAALSYLERGTGCHPHSFMNHVSLAECLHRLGDDSRAISEYEAGLREGSNQKGVLMNLSQLLMERGKSDRALEYLGRVIQLDPKDPEPRELLGRALVVRGRYEEAMTHLKWAVELGLDTEMLRKEISKCEAAMQAHDRRK
jgi:Tfp pilus assembly protein PilF